MTQPPSSPMEGGCGTIGDMTERAAIITLLILIFICVAVIAGVQAAEMSELAKWF